MESTGEPLGAVLVGGDSRRMGTDKARLLLGGESLAARAVHTLESMLGKVVVVSRRMGDHADLGVSEVVDRMPGTGPLAGIHAALEHAAGRPVFALACDLPAVGPELVRHLLRVSSGVFGEIAVARAVIPTLQGVTQPLCGLYSALCRAEIEIWLKRGDRRVLDFLGTVDTLRVELGPELPFYRDDLLDNVNDRTQARRLGVDLDVARGGS